MSLESIPYRKFMNRFKELGHSEEEITEFENGGKYGEEYYRKVCAMFGLDPPRPTGVCVCQVEIEHHHLVYRLRDKKCYLIGKDCIKIWKGMHRKQMCLLCKANAVKASSTGESSFICATCKKSATSIMRNGKHAGKTILEVISKDPGYCEFIRENIGNWAVKKPDYVKLVEVYNMKTRSGTHQEPIRNPSEPSWVFPSPEEAAAPRVPGT